MEVQIKNLYRNIVINQSTGSVVQSLMDNLNTTTVRRRSGALSIMAYMPTGTLHLNEVPFSGFMHVYERVGVSQVEVYKTVRKSKRHNLLLYHSK